MEALHYEIAKVLAASAQAKSRITYQDLGQKVGWGHPTGRGLGPKLEVILHHAADMNWPPLTTIVVPRGQRYPKADAMTYIENVLGPVDIEAAQQSVFSFDWTSIQSLETPSNELPDGRQIWLTSFWGFDPSAWGCIGFDDEPKRQRFLRLSKPGDLIAIYITKGSKAEGLNGKVVGILELSHTTGPAQDFISGDKWRAKELDPKSKGKWLHAVQATRAWEIAPEHHRRVETLFPLTYSTDRSRFIGASGAICTREEALSLATLDVIEVPVYKQPREINQILQPLASALELSKAVPPTTKPYIVNEVDGPKYLYILKLQGNIASYLGRPEQQVEDKSIIKVGFSKSPRTRCKQIQKSYPAGAFKWEVIYPKSPEAPAPYSNAAIAIVGEDAMKKRLVDEKAEPLGGEFCLAEDWLVDKMWQAGLYAANAAQNKVES